MPTVHNTAIAYSITLRYYRIILWWLYKRLGLDYNIDHYYTIGNYLLPTASYLPHATGNIPPAICCEQYATGHILPAIYHLLYASWYLQGNKSLIWVWSIYANMLSRDIGSIQYLESAIGRVESSRWKQYHQVQFKECIKVSLELYFKVMTGCTGKYAEGLQWSVQSEG